MLKIEYWEIGRLNEYKNNPRKNDHAVDKICTAIKEFGFKVPIIAKSDGTIVDGHLRFKAAKKLNLENVPVILADDLSEEQIKAFRISINKMSELAEWDIDLLKSEFLDLKGLDFDLELTGFSADEIDDLFKDKNSKDGDGDLYTNKIEAPIYTPTGPKPNIKDLFDISKTKRLKEKIDQTSLSKEEKEFLKFAACRHIVFNYQNIAEYYAHSEKEVQELMEESALVIIDYNKAIENGFLVLTKELAEASYDD